MLIAINYHYIKEQFNYKYPSIFGVTPEQFEKQLVGLKNYGEFISPSALLNWVRGNDKIPSKSFIVTFDDGLKEQYELALPILQKHNIPVIFFINTSNLDGKVSTVHKIHFLRSEISPAELMGTLKQYLPKQESNTAQYTAAAIEHYKYDDAESALLKYMLNFVFDYKELEAIINPIFEHYFKKSEAELAANLYMGADELTELSQKGYLGSHAHNHLPVGQLTDDYKEYQIKHSQEKIEQITHKKVDFFSYPYGSKSASIGMDKILQAASYSASFTMERAINHIPANPFLLSRFDNNDLVGGKAWQGGTANPFEFFTQKTWYNEA